MNKERLTKLREQLLSIPGGFDYSSFGYAKVDDTYSKYDLQYVKGHPCQTSACVAGWCMILNMPSEESDTYKDLYNADWFAGIYLELTYVEKRFLFYPDNHHASKLGFKNPEDRLVLTDYTLEDAIARIDHLLQMDSE